MERPKEQKGRGGLNGWRDGCLDKRINESSVDTVTKCEETERDGVKK